MILAKQLKFRGGDQKVSSVVNLTFPYIHSEAVLPAKAAIQVRNPGFRVKAGMTNKGKKLLALHTD
jgi:hypothetical protein